MRIISQNMEHDVPYEHCAIWTKMPESIIYATPIGEPDTLLQMAKYSTPEKAEKAMQKLHEAYAPEPLFIYKDVSPYERAAAGEMSWAQALNEVNTNLIVRPIQNSSIEQVYTGNVVFRFPQEDEI